MKLIARKPCSFGGKKYFIGDEIPSEEVIQPKTQERLGVLVILDTDGGKEEKKEDDAGAGVRKSRKKQVRILKAQVKKRNPETEKGGM